MYFNREEFKDAIHLRYGWVINDIPRLCECGKENSNDHALICQFGGFVILRHNAIGDLEAALLSNVCKDVEIEPALMPLNSGDILSHAANTEENARLDVSCRSFWRPLRKSFFDVRVTHPNCPSHVNKPQKTILKQNETIKKTQYNERVREIENASFTPLVFSTKGATGEEETHFHKVLAEKLSEKT